MAGEDLQPLRFLEAQQRLFTGMQGGQIAVTPLAGFADILLILQILPASSLQGLGYVRPSSDAALQHS